MVNELRFCLIIQLNQGKQEAPLMCSSDGTVIVNLCEGMQRMSNKCGFGFTL